MAATLPRKIPTRIEHTGHAPSDRAQTLARDVARAHEHTKAIVAALMNRAYAALAVDVAIGVAPYALLVSTTITTALARGNVDITFTASGANASSAANARFQVLVDGTPVKGTYAYTAAGQTFCGAIVVRVPVTAGTHTVTVNWKSDAGAARINAASVVEEHASLMVQEAR